MVAGSAHEVTEATSRTPVLPNEPVAGDQAPAGNGVAWPLATIHTVADAILHAVLYADLFDYPLTSQEIHRYLPRYRAPLATIEERITQHDGLGQRLGSRPPYWFLAGRDHLVALRQEREAYSQALWPSAWRYGRVMAAMPFVRMVAVTGSLAMNNVGNARDDVDLLIVTQRDRVWLARGFVILMVHLARRTAVELCPNYVLAEHRLELGEPSLFTAHELAQLVPLYGLGTYHRLLESNNWLVEYLPNAPPRQAGVHQIGPVAHHGQRLLEGVLGGRLGNALERWERQRKIPQLRQMAARRGGTGTVYTPDLCKGHVDDHAAAVRQRYATLLENQRL